MRVIQSMVQGNHPVVDVFKHIETRKPFKMMSVFEPFGGDTTGQTVHYAHLPFIERLTAWEIVPERASKAKHIIPDIDIKICDAFKEVHKLSKGYDIIVVDNNFLRPPHFEHFDLFPHIFKGLNDEAFMIITVCDAPSSYYVDRERFVRESFGSRTELFVKGWDRARADFYGFPRIEDEDYSTLQGRIRPMSDFSGNDMVPVYMEMALKYGFFTPYKTVMRRAKSSQSILLELKRGSDRQTLEERTKDKLLKKDAGKL